MRARDLRESISGIKFQLTSRTIFITFSEKCELPKIFLCSKGMNTSGVNPVK